MNCRDVVALLSAELDGELSAEESRTVRAHLPSCDECGRRYELLRDTREAFKSLAAEPPAGPRYVTTAALAAAIVAAIVVGAAVLRSPERFPEPVRNANAAADCGVAGASSCIVEVPPCGGGECALVLPAGREALLAP